MLRMHRRSESLLCYIIDIRSLPKGRSLFIHLINSLLHYQICDSEFIPRSVDGLQPTTPAYPFVRSMGPKTRNVYSPSARKYASYVNTPKTPYFGPTDIACLPGPKIDRNFRNFVNMKKKL
jgi:hypothetical protein